MNGFSVFRCLLATPAGAGRRDAGCGTVSGRGRHDGRHPGRERRRPARPHRRPASLPRGCGRPVRRPVPGSPGATRCGGRRPRSTGRSPPGSPARPRGPKGWGARDLESAYKLPVGRHPHQTVAVTIAYNTPHLRSLPGRLPQAVRSAGLHVRRGMLPRGQPERPHVPVAVLRQGQRLGPGNHPGHLDDLRGVPALPHPGRGGEPAVARRPGQGRGHRGPARCPGHFQQLRHP